MGDGDDDNVKASSVEFSNLESSAGETITASERIHAYVWVTKYRWIWISLILIGVFVGAFLGGYATGMTIHISNDDPIPPQDFNSQISVDVRGAIKASDIDAEVKILTKSIHQAGTADNEAVAKQLVSIWKSAELNVREHVYTDVLLQFPYKNIPNTAQIVSKEGTTGNIKFTTTNADGYFNAYSSTNNDQPVEAKLVYVNYGTFRDFETLKNYTGNCNSADKFVAIARYGFGSRRAILRHAEEFCADSSKQSPISALLMYPDPSDFAPDANTVWPNGPFLRSSDAMFGTLLGGTGDPLSPGLPSIDGVYREELASSHFTNIVVQSISYGDAAVLMKDLKNVAPEKWKGNLSIPYYGVGPGYAANEDVVRVNVKSDTANSRKPIKNIISVIRGDAEMDRYVIVGAHYDSWTFGGNDPNGASSIVNRLAIAFKQKASQGWKPRRSIVFAHWDAELFHKIGSQEFVEHFGPEIQKRVVAYVNVDLAVEGGYTFQASGHPLLAKVAYESTKQFGFPNDPNGRNVYEMWKLRTKANVLNEPPVNPVGKTSDIWAFWGQYGIPYLYPVFRAQSANAPYRNTLLDTYDMINKFVDPGFTFHELLGRIIADSVTRLSDTAILPYSFVTFSETLSYEFELLANSSLSLINDEIRTYFDRVRTGIKGFSVAAKSFEKQLSELSVSSLSDNTVRIWNDLILTAPQAFSNSYNLEYRRFYSLIYGADYYEDSSVSYFPGVYRALIDLHSKDTASLGTLMIKRELSALFVAFKQATDILSSNTLID